MTRWDIYDLQFQGINVHTFLLINVYVYNTSVGSQQVNYFKEILSKRVMPLYLVI